MKPQVIFVLFMGFLLAACGAPAESAIETTSPTRFNQLEDYGAPPTETESEADEQATTLPATAEPAEPQPTDTAEPQPTDTTEPTESAPPPTGTTAPTVVATAVATTVATPEEAATPTDEAASPSRASVMIENFQFSPGNVTVAAGSTVIWTQLDDIRHTVTADDGSFDSATLTSGDVFEFTFTNPGTYSYYCRFHGSAGNSGMSGTITVTE